MEATCTVQSVVTNEFRYGLEWVLLSQEKATVGRFLDVIMTNRTWGSIATHAAPIEQEHLPVWMDTCTRDVEGVREYVNKPRPRKTQSR